MNPRSDWVRLPLAVLIASPFIFAWAYVGPEEPDTAEFVAGLLFYLVVATGSYLLAGRVIEFVARRR